MYVLTDLYTAWFMNYHQLSLMLRASDVWIIHWFFSADGGDCEQIVVLHFSLVGRVA